MALGSISLSCWSDRCKVCVITRLVTTLGSSSVGVNTWASRWDTMSGPNCRSEYIISSGVSRFLPSRWYSSLIGMTTDWLSSTLHRARILAAGDGWKPARGGAAEAPSAPPPPDCETGSRLLSLSALIVAPTLPLYCFGGGGGGSLCIEVERTRGGATDWDRSLAPIPRQSRTASSGLPVPGTTVWNAHPGCGAFGSMVDSAALEVASVWSG